jgi:hypothetical protein
MAPTGNSPGLVELAAQAPALPTDSWCMGEQPPFWQEKANRMIGKTVLVGKTYLQDDQEVDRIQFHGPIEMVDEQAGVAIRRIDNGEIEWLPPDLRAYFPAEEGVYTLKSSGEEVHDPDFLTTWTIDLPAE